MVSIRIRVDSREALNRLRMYPDAVGQAMARWVQKGGLLVQGTMREVIRSKQKQGKGVLSNSVQVQVRESGFTVGPSVEYAEFVDQPTRPHLILPVRKQALAFARSGGTLTRSRATGHVRTKFRFGGHTSLTGPVFARAVHHPGTRGMFFIEETTHRVVGQLKSLLEAEIDAAAKGLGEA